MAFARSLPFTIPKCVKRSKTAVLEALSSTVGVDKTAPHFAFIDDPTTIPTSVRDRRNYYLAKEFGRRTARQLAVEWPTLFMFDRDKPRLEAFRPDKIPSLIETEHVDENALQKLIDAKHVTGAITVFERLRAANTKLSSEVVQNLFFLAAYFNAEDPPPSENEEWPGVRNYFTDPQPNTSQSAELVSLLYSMVEQNAKNTSTMICWLNKYGGELMKDRVLKMFETAVAAKMVLEEDAFISMISASGTIEEVNGLLKKMAQLNMYPSIRTFNAALVSINKTKNVDVRWKAVQQCLAEANRLNLEPNLTTYTQVLNALRADQIEQDVKWLSCSVNCLSELLDKLEAQSLIECQQFTDQHFFNSAMIIATLAKNVTLMDRIVQLYESKKNHVQMTAFTVEGEFYNLYGVVKLRMSTDPNEINEIYRSLVPRLVGTGRDMLKLMLVKLRFCDDWPLKKRVVEDALCSCFLLDEDMLKKLSDILQNVKVDELEAADLKHLQEKLESARAYLASLKEARS